MMDEEELFDGVIGGGDTQTKMVREDIEPSRGPVATSATDKKLLRLLTLHPEHGPKFRNNSLSGLDEKTKLTLIRDIQDSLGIVPLRDVNIIP